MSLPDGEPAGLYVHIPFCSAICPYCDFAVLVGNSGRRRRFVETLLLEIGLHVDSPFSPVDTIYFGGGTPSLLDPPDLERLLSAIRKVFKPTAEARIYLEANPEDIGRAALSAWLDLGVTTLSLGVQSFDDDELRFLGRRHTANEARRAVELASKAEFETVSVDLIYGLPDQSAGAVRRNLETAASLEPEHLSCYELEIHRRTTFGKRRARGELSELPNEKQADLFCLTHETLEATGYEGYEVSNFAREPVHRSTHNRKYWRHVPYLGLGPSAHSFDSRRRWWNERSMTAWERAICSGRRPEAGGETLTRQDLALEKIMLGLRTREGLNLEDFALDSGTDLLASKMPTVQRAMDEGLLCLEADRLKPTLKGFAVADGLAAELATGLDCGTTQ